MVVMVASSMETQTHIMNKKVAVVILNWNGKHYLEKFLPSICASTYPNLEIVVGDNASTDGSVDFLIENHPTIRIIRFQQNYGFAEGYNRALQEIAADYFVLLNSDVSVTPNWIESMITFMETDTNIAAAQPKILAFHQPTCFEHAGAAGGYMDWLGYPFCAGRVLDTIEIDHGQYNQNTEVFWASGAALFIRSVAWEKVGGFDGDFFAHMEEIDLCWRLKQWGYMIGYCAQSHVFHVGGGTLQKENPFKTYLNFRNNLMMLQKNLPLFQAIYIIFLRLWLDLLAWMRFIWIGQRKDAWAINKAHAHFFRDFKKTAMKRKAVKRKTVTNGVYRASIIWAYFVLGKRTFDQLNPKKWR